ncbi:hypothetical protein GSbR_27040 [Geobacter sp. SVR]|nr:hypothetical protein GSVR_36130 [Geobacter sp. SVR]GCF86104.1 hypothetical protein GSbR_27040 [Geobacter sp. SVR]
MISHTVGCEKENQVDDKPVDTTGKVGLIIPGIMSLVVGLIVFYPWSVFRKVYHFETIAK